MRTTENRLVLTIQEPMPRDFESWTLGNFTSRSQGCAASPLAHARGRDTLRAGLDGSCIGQFHHLRELRRHGTRPLLRLRIEMPRGVVLLRSSAHDIAKARSLIGPQGKPCRSKLLLELRPVPRIGNSRCSQLEWRFRQSDHCGLRRSHAIRGNGKTSSQPASVHPADSQRALAWTGLLNPSTWADSFPVPIKPL